MYNTIGDNLSMLVEEDTAKFKADLANGKALEEYIRKYLAMSGYYVLENESEYIEKSREYDLYVIELDIADWTVECKNDRFSAKSKNSAFEASCNGTPSGLMATKADYWVQAVYTDDKAYFVFAETKWLRHWLFLSGQTSFIRQNVGDNNSTIILVDKNDFIREFRGKNEFNFVVSLEKAKEIGLV